MKQSNNIRFFNILTRLSLLLAAGTLLAGCAPLLSGRNSAPVELSVRLSIAAAFLEAKASTDSGDTPPNRAFCCRKPAWSTWS